MSSPTTPEHRPKREIKALLIGTPSTSAPPAFGQAIGELIFVLRAHGIECRESKAGMTMLEAFTSSAEKPDAVLWLQGDVEFRQEDALALVEAVREGVNVAGLLVPSAEGIDWARVRQAVKKRATLDQLAGAGLAYDVTLTETHHKIAGKWFCRAEQLPLGVTIVHSTVLDTVVASIHRHDGNAVDEFALADACRQSLACVLESAPTSRRLSSTVSLVCKEPEWMLSELTDRQRPIVEGDWRARAFTHGFAITTVAFNERVEEIFAPVAQMLCEGLREAGFCAAVLPRNATIDLATWHRERVVPPLQIILGAHIAQPDVDIPPGSIFYCAEQPAPEWVKFIRRECELFRPSVVWSWAESTTRALKAAGLPVVTVPLGYVEGMRRELPRVEKDIDVLFFGGPTERRRAILSAITQRGLRVQYERSCWGEKKDALVARSKVVLNIRGNDLGVHGGVFEIVRALPLMAQGIALVSEKGEGWERFQSGCRFVDRPEQIPDAVAELVRDDSLRSFLEKEALASARAQPQSYWLRKLFE